MKRVRLVIVLVSLGAAAVASARGATVRIHSRASISGTVIRLGDVAQVLDDDPDLQQRLARVPLGPAPSRGNTVKLDFADIRSRLRALGIDASRIRFGGRNSVLVTRPAKRSPVSRTSFSPSATGAVPNDWQTERAEQMLAGAVQRTLRRLAPRLGKLTVATQLDPRDATAVLARTGRDYEVSGFRQPIDRPQQLTARFVDRGGKARAVRFVASLSRMPYVLAAKHGIPRGELVQADDLVWTQAKSVGDGFDEVKQLVGSETRRAIPKDTVILRSYVRRVPLVRTNDIVTVAARRGGITVKRQMKSRGTGALGETITLVELNGRGEVLAKVSGLHEAEVLSTGTRDLSTGDRSVVFRRPAASKKSRLRRTTGARRHIRPAGHSANTVIQSGLWRRVDSRPVIERKPSPRATTGVFDGEERNAQPSPGDR